MVRRRSHRGRTRQGPRRMTVQDPWLGKYHSREKIWEFRANSNMYKKIKVGDIIVFKNKTCPLGEVSMCVHERMDRDTFLDLFKEIPLSQVLPGYEGDVQQAIDDEFYKKFKLKSKERDHGVVGFRMAPISAPIPTSTSDSTTCSPPTTEILTTPSSDEGGMEPVLSGGDSSRKRKRRGRGQGKNKVKNKKRSKKRKEKAQEVFVYVIVFQSL